MSDQKALVVRRKADPSIASIKLIKPTSRDQLLARVESLTKRPPKVGAEYEYLDAVQRFNQSFNGLCWRYFKLSSLQQKELKDKDLVLMAEEILVRAKQERKSALIWAVPSFGFSWCRCLLERDYLAAYQELKERYGNDFFPHRQFKQFLKNDVKGRGVQDEDLEDEPDSLEEEEDMED